MLCTRARPLQDTNLGPRSDGEVSLVPQPMLAGNGG